MLLWTSRFENFASLASVVASFGEYDMFIDGVFITTEWEYAVLCSAASEYLGSEGVAKLLAKLPVVSLQQTIRCRDDGKSSTWIEVNDANVAKVCCFSYSEGTLQAIEYSWSACHNVTQHICTCDDIACSSCVEDGLRCTLLVDVTVGGKIGPRTEGWEFHWWGGVAHTTVPSAILILVILFIPHLAKSSVDIIWSTGVNFVGLSPGRIWYLWGWRGLSSGLLSALTSTMTGFSTVVTRSTEFSLLHIFSKRDFRLLDFRWVNLLGFFFDGWFSPLVCYRLRYIVDWSYICTYITRYYCNTRILRTTTSTRCTFSLDTRYAMAAVDHIYLNINTLFSHDQSLLSKINAATNLLFPSTPWPTCHWANSDANLPTSIPNWPTCQFNNLAPSIKSIF